MLASVVASFPDLRFLGPRLEMVSVMRNSQISSSLMNLVTIASFSVKDNIAKINPAGYISKVPLNPLIVRHLSVLAIYLSLFLNRAVTALLLGLDKWKEMLRSSERHDGREPTPLMRQLITFMPGKLVFNPLAPFSDLLHLQLLIACSMQK